MTRHLQSVDTAINQFVKHAIAEKFAADVISGRVVHNVETDVFCLREKATPEFLVNATAAYARLIDLADK